MNIGKYLNGTEIAEWRPIPGTNAEVKFRVIKPKRMRELLEQARKPFYDGRRSGEKTDSTTLNNLMLDEMIVEWKNIEDANGSPLACTADNKRLLEENWPAFSTLFNQVWLERGEREAVATEDSQKN